MSTGSGQGATETGLNPARGSQARLGRAAQLELLAPSSQPPAPDGRRPRPPSRLPWNQGAVTQALCRVPPSRRAGAQLRPPGSTTLRPRISQGGLGSGPPR